MNVSIETTSNLERRLTIVVPSETFEDQITERLKNASGQIRLPGFRPGKVPMKEVRRRFGKAVRSEVAGELMQSSFVEAITEEQLSPAGSPSLEVVKMDPGIDFEFTATFEVFPAITLADLGQVEVSQPQASIEEHDIDAMVENLREQRKTHTPVERAAAAGDQVTIDFVGRLDGEPFEGGSGEDVSFVLGAGQMIEDFDKGVTGKAAGDEGTFDATFPDEYQAEHLAGKTVQFEVKVKAVNEPTLPELDSEFFAGFGLEDGTLEAFREQVQENMQRELDNAVKNQVRRQVMDELARLHEFPIPQAMIANEIQGLKQQMLQQFQMPPGGAANQPDLPDELFADQAERRVQVGLIVNEIVQQNELSADPEAVRAHIETLAATYDEPQQVVNWYYGNAEQLQQVEMSVLEDQVIDHIMRQAVVKPVPASYADTIADKVVNAKPEAAAGDAETEGDADTKADAEKTEDSAAGGNDAAADKS